VIAAMCIVLAQAQHRNAGPGDATGGAQHEPG
jgi:hypothetical protein